MTLACNWSTQLATATAFCLQSCSTECFRSQWFRWGTGRSEKQGCPAKTCSMDPHLTSSCALNLPAKIQGKWLPVGGMQHLEQEHARSEFLGPTSDASANPPVMSAFQISFLQVAKMETASRADWWTRCDKSHPESQPALPGDPALGFCKAKDRPLRPGIYAFKMLVSSYETIKYFLQQQQVSTESVLNIWPEVLRMLNNL